MQTEKMTVALRKQVFLPMISEIGDQTNGNPPCAKM